MKYSNRWFTLLFSFLFTTISIAQQNHLDVEGNAKIRGNIDINHPDDTTSVFIGRETGKNTRIYESMFGTFVGSYAGHKNSGDKNSFFGQESGLNNTGGHSNSFFGCNAGKNNIEGLHNSFFGDRTGFDNTSGDYNSFFGQAAGQFNTSGFQNSFFGTGAGTKNIDGTRNTFIGNLANPMTNDSIDRSIAIGYNAKVDCSHCAVIGGTDKDTVNVGIGTTTPEVRLHVVGDQIRLVSKNGSNRNIQLRTDGSALDIDGIGGNIYINPDPNLVLVNGGGKVIIGTDVPDLAPLSIKGIDTNSEWISFRDNTGTGRWHVNYKDGGFNFSESGATDGRLFLKDGGNVGIGTTNPNNSLVVIGDIQASGCIKHGDGAGTSLGGTCVSDKRLKDAITLLGSQLEKINALNPVRFKWNNPQMGNQGEIGFIAQEVEEVIPEMVVTDEDGMKRIRYDISLQVRIIKAIQEQQEIIDNQQSEIESLKDELSKVNDLEKKIVRVEQMLSAQTSSSNMDN